MEAVKTLADTTSSPPLATPTQPTRKHVRPSLPVHVATHLFNAMRPLHHREPGPVLALLEDERITLEVIADGLHVDDALLRWLVADRRPRTRRARYRRHLGGGHG